MNSIASTIGLDIAKHVFVAVGLDPQGKVLWKKTLRRDEVLPTFANLPPTPVGVEACSGSHYWARQLRALGHDVKLIAAQHTRAYVTGNKNDVNDAAAIAEARSRAATKSVAINTEAQQDLQMLHRARQALMEERKAMICRIHALAHEYGTVFPIGVAKSRSRLALWLTSETHGLSGMALETFHDLVAPLDDKEARLQVYDRRLAEAARANAKAKRLFAVPGMGILTATAMVASVADASDFKTGRDLSANLGLAPREHRSGGKQRLYGITKRGDWYRRTLLIHGARSALRGADTGRMIEFYAGHGNYRRDEGTMSPLSPWRTNWPASFGRCWSTEGSIKRITGSPEREPGGPKQGHAPVNEPTKVAKVKKNDAPQVGPALD